MTNATTNRTIKLDITSDAICPFCFGLRKIEAAIKNVKAKTPEVDFAIQFHPFLLDPTLGKTPTNKRARYEAKFGGKERVAAMEVAMKERAKEVGINLSYGGEVRQTHDAHRLLTLAYNKGGEDMQLKLLNRLFEGYFEQEKDVGDAEFLALHAVESGLFDSTEEAKTFLSSSTLDADVQAAYKRAQSLGISGVPFTVIDKRYGVSGAQEIETFTEILEKVVKGEEP